MNYADALSEQIHDAADSLWRTVQATPADKLEWRPETTCRTIRELLEELVYTTTYSAELIRSQKNPEMPESGKEISMTVKDLEAAHREAVEEYLRAVRQFPEGNLHDTIKLPWGEMNFLQIIFYPYWNLVYHWGQISYLQTMYGDKEMH